ncbi:MAG TPA: tRNA pseudouridine(13) synthase TruD [Xanthomonadales bacterium]|nr:tRNA pseudouridine(13) synthase TruD [Xanthomonadales bacterium]
MIPAPDWTLAEWPYALGKPALTGLLRSQPEDFEVEEMAAFEPCGQGTHLWLWVEKTGANTDWVATQLARAAGCPPRDVGYAGMKDRHAVTRQWFSLPWKPGQEAVFPDPGIEGVRVLKCNLHEKKLRRGILKGNRFQLRLRQLQGDLDSLDTRLDRIALDGVPNYFGPQRFGFGGANVQRAVQWLEHGGRLPRDKRSIYLSALRSYLFNRVLAERVSHGSWNQLLEGELAMLDGTHSIFPCETGDETLLKRCAEFDIHPTGPMPGRGGMQPQDAALDLERAVLHVYDAEIARLADFGVDAERRSLRLRVEDLGWELQQGELLLGFRLPAGAYATTVLRELVGVD